MMRFLYTISHVPGKELAIADALASFGATTQRDQGVSRSRSGMSADRRALPVRMASQAVSASRVKAISHGVG